MTLSFAYALNSKIPLSVCQTRKKGILKKAAFQATYDLLTAVVAPPSTFVVFPYQACNSLILLRGIRLVLRAGSILSIGVCNLSEFHQSYAIIILLITFRLLGENGDLPIVDLNSCVDADPLHP